MSQRTSFRTKQREVLSEMIRSAVPSESVSGSGAGDDGPEASWKLLVFDQVGMNIIAPLFKVKDLRDLGVTLHMPIDKPREPVPGAPAIYFCAPTEANISRIAQDCVSELYQWYYINFTAQISRRLLESLAEQLSAGGKLRSIRHIKVVDRTLSYVAVANDLFTLLSPKTLLTLNSRHTQDAQMEECLQSIAQGVTHAVLSTQSLPVVAFAKGGAAEEVGKRIAANLNELLSDRSFTPSPAAALGRPLLLVVDRTADLTAALHHPFTYRGLLTDTVGMRLNKVNAVSDGKEKSFELDPDTDAFFKANAGADFGSVGANVEAALADYKREVAQFSADSGIAVGDVNDAASMSKMLANAPRLTEKKRSLDAHMTIAYSILKRIKEHELDGFHGVEAGVLTREGLDHDHFVKLMEGPAPIEDKQRLYLIAYLMSENDSDVQQLERFLPHVTKTAPPPPQQNNGSPSSPSASQPSSKGFPALQYVKHLRSWSLGGQAAAHSHSPASASSSSLSNGWGFAQTIAKGIANTLKGSSETEFAVTRLVDALLQDTSALGNNRAAQAARLKILESIAALDPKTKNPVDLSDARFQHAIVFVVGGGSVSEFDNLKHWESKHPRKSITFGATEILQGCEVLEQLTQLGSE